MLNINEKITTSKNLYELMQKINNEHRVLYQFSSLSNKICFGQIDFFENCENDIYVKNEQIFVDDELMNFDTLQIVDFDKHNQMYTHTIHEYVEMYQLSIENENKLNEWLNIQK